MRAKEVVSEPANMKVFMLWRMSSSDTRCSGGRSIAALDLTIGSHKKKTTESRTEKHTEERQQVPAFVRFPTVLALLDSPFFLLDELHCYTIDCLLTPTHDMRRLVRLLLGQRRTTGPRTILTKKRSYVGKYVMIAFLKL